MAGPVLPLFSWRPTYQGCVFSPTFPYRTNYKLQCSTFCAAPVCRSRVTRRVLSGAKDHGDFLKRGGGWRHSQAHPPPPLDIVRVTSPALRKIEKRPHSWTFTKGGGPTLGPMLKSLHRGPKGGGPDPLDPPPPWIRHCYYPEGPKRVYCDWTYSRYITLDIPTVITSICMFRGHIAFDVPVEQVYWS